MRRRWHSVAYALVATTAACAVVFGCSVITSFDGYGGEDPACPNRRVIPQRPPESSSSRGGPTLTGAMSGARFLFLKKVGAGVEVTAPAGYDIDNACSTASTPRSGSCTSIGKAVFPDQPGTGGDNAIGENIRKLVPRSDLFDQLVATGIDPIGANCKLGRHGLVITVSDYDGSDDDDKVTVEVVNVLGLAGQGDAGGAQAKFDGTDQFIADRSDFTCETTQAFTSDPSAFVRNGTLYASFGKEFRIRLVAPNIGPDDKPVEATTHIPLSQMRIIGAIKKDSRGLNMEKATITGRISLKSAFEAIFEYGVCPERKNFDKVPDTLCSLADVLASGDNVPTRKCDAVSFAFEADFLPAAKLVAANKASAPDGGLLCTSAPPTGCQ